MDRIRRALFDDLQAILSLLKEVSLPIEGVKEHLSDFLIATRNQQVIGTAGLELYKENAVLRSVAVQPGSQGMGIGESLTKAVIDFARENQVEHLYLLTQTAEQYFKRWGFEQTDRNVVPPIIAKSVEFSSVCPSTAICMVLHL